MIHGQAQWSEPYAVFDSENAKITKRLRRFKRRLRGHDHQSPVPEGLDVQELVFTAESEAPADVTTGDPLEWPPVLVAEMTTRIEFLTVGSTVMHLELTDAPVLMFRNATRGDFNVVFRLADGNIGWIDPRGTAKG